MEMFTAARWGERKRTLFYFWNYLLVKEQLHSCGIQFSKFNQLVLCHLGLAEHVRLTLDLGDDVADGFEILERIRLEYERFKVFISIHNI